MITFTAPWSQNPLNTWSIISMRHGVEKGEQWLYVSMVREGRTIEAKGQDNRDIWADLYRQAMKFETK